MNENQKYLLLILALYFSLTLIYSLVVPLWEAPDEPSHYLCVRRFSDGSRFKPPPSSGDYKTVWSEAYLFSLYQRSQPPLYYLISAPIMKVLSPGVLLPGEGNKFPAVLPDFSGTGRLFIHERESNLSIPSPEIRGHLMRLFSILLGGLTIVCIYRIARVVFSSNPEIALLSGAFAATLPQFNFISGVISNDSLAMLMGAVTLLFLVRSAGKGVSLRARDSIYLGMLILVSLLTKFNLIFLIPLSIIVIIIKARDAGSWKAGLGGVFLMFLPVLAGITAAGILFPREVMVKYRVLIWRLCRTTPDLVTVEHFQWMLKDIYRSFWATFGWMSIRVGWWLYLAWGLICLAGLAGWVKAIISRPGLDGDGKRRSGILLTAIVFLLMGVIKNNLLVHQSQGRFLFPALGAIAVLLSSGVLYLFDEQSRMKVTVICITAFIALNMVSLFGYLIPSYFL